jgi:hypothetical protein
MKIVVIGGIGLIGSETVAILRQGGLRPDRGALSAFRHHGGKSCGGGPLASVISAVPELAA